MQELNMVQVEEVSGGVIAFAMYLGEQAVIWAIRQIG